MTDKLTVDDVMRSGGCANGIRRWFTDNQAKLPSDVNLRSFIEEGMPMDVALSLNDPFIERALKLREAPNGQQEQEG